MAGKETTEEQVVEQTVAQVEREHVINRRNVEWVEIQGHHYAYYVEPTYRDKLYIDDKNVQVDMGMEQTGPNGAPQPTFGGMVVINREFLIVSRAIAKWTREEPLSEDAIQDLPLSVASILETTIMAQAEWRKLGEASPVRA